MASTSCVFWCNRWTETTRFRCREHSSESLGLCSSPRDGSRHERCPDVAFFTHDLFSQQGQRRRNLWPPPSFVTSHVPKSTARPKWGSSCLAFLEQSSFGNPAPLLALPQTGPHLRPAGSLRKPGLHPRGHDHPHLHAREIMGRDLQRQTESPALPGLVLHFAGTALAAVCSNGAGNAARSPARACAELYVPRSESLGQAVSGCQHLAPWVICLGPGSPCRLCCLPMPVQRFASATRLSLSRVSCVSEWLE